MSEAQTRAQLINPQLEHADWDLGDRTQVRFEVSVTGYDPTPWNGFTDYSLYDPSGQVIAVVEAKRTARSPREGEEQLRQYIAEIARTQPSVPFGFMSNGLHTYFWDVDQAHPRVVAGFFTPDDLARLSFIRANRTPLSETAINNLIVDRGYQHEAIRRVSEDFTAGRRRALLVMATGTGKTRTTMGLIDVFMRSSWAQRVLFVADRDALVEQALTDGFKAHLPSEPRARIHTANIDKTLRLYVSTLQTMGKCYEKFSPAFFDLIIFDEAHRSIFNRFNEVIELKGTKMSIAEP
jgi:type I restriction enzyme, R subunit